MILTSKGEEYTKVLCQITTEFIDPVWGDCSVTKGEWYDAIVKDGSYDNLVNSEFILVRFENGLCSYKRSIFKTQSQIREQKIDSVINQEDDDYCYYSGLPSPKSYEDN